MDFQPGQPSGRWGHQTSRTFQPGPENTHQGWRLLPSTTGSGRLGCPGLSVGWAVCRGDVQYEGVWSLSPVLAQSSYTFRESLLPGGVKGLCYADDRLEPTRRDGGGHPRAGTLSPTDLQEVEGLEVESASLGRDSVRQACVGTPRKARKDSVYRAWVLDSGD